MFDFEEMDYQLFDQVTTLATDLKAYKAQHGIFPEKLTTVRNTPLQPKNGVSQHRSRERPNTLLTLSAFLHG